MSKKATIICKRGLGDSLIFLTLAENLVKNGFEVHLFTDCLSTLESLFPRVKISSCCEIDLPKVVTNSDSIFIKSDREEKIKMFIQEAKNHLPLSTYEIHPTTCKSKGRLPGDVQINPKISMVENLVRFCEEDLHLTRCKKGNGIQIPPNWVYRKNPKRIIIHPTSSVKERNWPEKKYKKLYQSLEKQGWKPLIVMTEKEKKEFSPYFCDGIEVVAGKTLYQVAKLIYESEYFIGSDSGLGHLASNLGISTVTIFAVKRKKNLWLPGWAKGLPACSLPILPNWKFLRLQNHFWHHFLSVSRVLSIFDELVKLT